MNRVIGLLFLIFIGSSIFSIFRPNTYLQKFFVSTSIQPPFAFFTLLPGVPKAVITNICFKLSNFSETQNIQKILEIGCGKALSLTDYQLAYTMAYPTLRNFNVLPGANQTQFSGMISAFLEKACRSSKSHKSSVELLIEFKDFNSLKKFHTLRNVSVKNCNASSSIGPITFE